MTIVIKDCYLYRWSLINCKYTIEQTPAILKISSMYLYKCFTEIHIARTNFALLISLTVFKTAIPY